jgi:pimeloyl-ACP methyl ester carboxylesterase
VPFIELASSALAPGQSPVRVHYRDAGAGPPIVMLHGGWGYEIYPFERQIEALGASWRLIAPDRTGYGRSGRIDRQATDFHHRAAAETLAVIDALGLDRPVVWGHSDGAVIAVLMGLADPDRLAGLILEAAHFLRRKPASRAFFETMMTSPDDLGERVTAVLAREHGDGWRDLIRTNGDAWLRIANDAAAPTADLYGGRLGDLRVPTLLIHGARDPRTEPGELESMREAIGRTHGSAPTGAGVSAPTSAGVGADLRVGPAVFEVLPEGGHSPHSERATADDVTRIAQRFLRDLRRAAADLLQPLALPDPPDLRDRPDPSGLPDRAP